MGTNRLQYVNIYLGFDSTAALFSLLNKAKNCHPKETNDAFLCTNEPSNKHRILQSLDVWDVGYIPPLQPTDP